MKSIIFVPTQKHDPIPDSFWGLGDIFRGIIGIYHFSKKNNYNLIIDISHHPISFFLKQKTHVYSNLVEEYKNKIPFIYPKDVENYINTSFKEKDYVMLFANYDLSIYDMPCENELVNLIDNILIPTDEFNNYILTKMNSIPYQQFNIYHYRLGDEKINKLEEISDNYIAHLRYNFNGENSILLSDNLVFKNSFINLTNLFIFTEDIAHIGYEKNNDLIKHTLFEFILLKHASNIYTYSIYAWVSGFVKIANYIYKIPLINIKN